MNKPELKNRIAKIIEVDDFNPYDIIKDCVYCILRTAPGRNILDKDSVILIACGVVGINPKQIGDQSRDALLVRFLTFDYYRRNSGYSLETISAIFGKSHATVLNSLRTHKNLIETDKTIRSKYEEFRNLLNY